MVRGSPSASALELTGVTAGYGAAPAVIEGLDLRVDGPALVRLAGRNGRGKSTLVELISGYLRPRRGEVRVNGLAASSPAAREARRVCRAHPALFGEMTARDHLHFAARCAGADPVEAVARFERYGAAAWLDSAASRLSTGNMRKLWIVMCTQGEFSLVALDEPFEGLDDAGGGALLDEIERWRLTSLVLVVAHHPPSGLRFARTITMGPTEQNDVDAEEDADAGERADAREAAGNAG